MINKFLKDKSLENYNTLGTKGISKYLFLPTTTEDLVKGITFLKSKHIDYIILGNGSNIILSDNYFEGCVVVTKKIQEIKIIDNELEVSAGVMLPYLNNHLLSLGYINFWWGAHLPGTVGGSVKGNAGCLNNETFDNLIDVKVLKDGIIHTLKKEEIEYGYRTSNISGIILSAKFKLEAGDVTYYKEQIKEFLEKRNKTQPIKHKNAGSTFKNPENNYAGKLIEEIGFKNKCINDACVSDTHANFIINKNSATFDDIMKLIELIKLEVKNKYNIELELENRVIKW